MNRLRSLFFVLLALVFAAPAFASGFGSGGSGVGGIPSTLSGKTCSSCTLSGTTTNNGTISGGNIGTVTFSAAPSSSAPCATGFSREGVDFCRSTSGGIAVGTIATTSGCTLSTALSGVSTAKRVLVQAQSSAYSANAIAIRYISARAYGTDSTCSVVLGNFDILTREFAATTATAIAAVQYVVTMPSNSSGEFYYKAVGGTTGSQVVLNVLGYYDD